MDGQDCDLTSLERVVPAGRDFSMHVPSRDRDHYISGNFGRTTADLLSRILKGADLFIDIGAHYGFFSLLAASAHPKLAIVALEPVPASSEILRRNVELSGHKHVNIQCAAASAATGRATDFLVTAALNRCGFHDDPEATIIDRIEVETKSVDTLLASRAVDRTIIRIGTNGHELAVLAGMSESLRRGLNIRLLLEFDPTMLRRAGHEPVTLLQEVDRLGFAIFLIDDRIGRFCRLRPDDSRNSLFDPTISANLYCVPKDKALSVVFFVHSAQLSGAERSLIELVDELVADHGVVCTVVAPNAGPLVESMKRCGAVTLIAEMPWWACQNESQRHQVRSSLVRGSQAVCTKLLERLSMVDPDVIFTQTMVIPWGALAAAALGRPHVWSICEYGERDHGLRFVEGFDQVIADIKKSANYILTAIQDIRTTLFSDVDAEHITTAYRHIPIPDVLAPSSSVWRRVGAIKLGLFGAISEGKGQREAIEAAAALVRRGRDVELVVAGAVAEPGYNEELKALVETAGLSDRVTFAGFLEEPLSTVAAADIVLACSRSEAFGRSAVEAMLLARPIVYARSGGFVEYLEDGSTGLAYTSGNVEELARCIERMIDDPASACEMGLSARAVARRRFSRDAYGGEIFRKLLVLRSRANRPIEVPRCIAVAMASAIVDLQAKNLASAVPVMLGKADDEHARSRSLDDVALLQHRDAETGELRRWVASLQEVLKQRELQIERMQEAVAAAESQRETETANLKRLLDDGGATLAHRDIQGEEMRKWIASLQHVLEQRDLQISRIQEVMTNAELRATQRETEAVQLQGRLAETEARITHWGAENAELRRWVASLQDVLGQREIQIERLREALSAAESHREAETMNLRLLLDDGVARLAHRDSEVSELRRWIASIQDVLSHRDAELLNLRGREVATQTEAAQREAAIAELQTGAAMREVLLAQRDCEIASLSTRAGELETSLSILKKSNSWRVTAPLRALRKLFSRTYA